MTDRALAGKWRSAGYQAGVWLASRCRPSGATTGTCVLSVMDAVRSMTGDGHPGAQRGVPTTAMRSVHGEVRVIQGPRAQRAHGGQRRLSGGRLLPHAHAGSFQAAVRETRGFGDLRMLGMPGGAVRLMRQKATIHWQSGTRVRTPACAEGRGTTPDWKHREYFD